MPGFSSQSAFFGHWCSNDAIEQCPRFGGIEHHRLTGRHDVPRPAHSVRRVDRHDLAVDQPVEQVA